MSVFATVKPFGKLLTILLRIATFYPYHEFFKNFIVSRFSEHRHRFAFAMTYCLQKQKVGKKKDLEQSSFDNHCEKYAEMRAFSDTYFPIYGQNSIRISPNKDRVVDRKKRIRESPYFGIFYKVNI